MTNKNKGAKLFVSTLLILLLCTSMTSIVWAAPEESEPQTSPEEDSTVTSGDPILHPSEEDPVLIQGNDDVTDAAEDANTEDEPNLIAPRSTSDDTAAKIGAVVLAAGMAVVAAVAVVLNRKKQAT
jgi:hypothetical protein